MAELYRLVRDSELFDGSWYRGQSTGARLFPGPILHYALVGWKARLNPSPRFDTAFYWDSYRDVRELGANPLVHYLLHGQKEGRLATTTGKAVRAAHIPYDTPLPLFTAPSANVTRLSVVIDDHTPQVMGLGLTPVVALATATAARHNWMLRFILRSTHITRQNITDATPRLENPPHVDVVVRSPGHTADVECVEGEKWWATSATSRASLRDFVPPENLWWVIAANEVDRHPAGELRLLATSQLSDPTVRTIVFDKTLHDTLSPAGPSTVIDSMSELLAITPVANTTRSRIGVVVDERAQENLFVHSLKLIEEALATGVIDPDTWHISLLGSINRPVTLTGSVVPGLASPQSPAEWAREVGSCDVLVALGAGTEPGYLAHHAQAIGIRAVYTDCQERVGGDLMASLRSALSAKKGSKRTAMVSLADVAATLDALWSNDR